MTHRPVVISIVVAVLAGAGIATLALTSSSPAPKKTAIFPVCPAPPVFHSNETFVAPLPCYTLTKGIYLNHLTNLTIDGGLWQDPNKSPGRPYGGTTPHGRPTFNIVGGSNVTLENMHIIGVNDPGGYHADLAYGAGIESQGVTNLTVSNVNVEHVFGDCLDLEPLRSGTGQNGIVTPTTNLLVNGFNGNVCGRNGISPVSVDGAQFTDVTIGTTGYDPWDFEDDVLGEGAKNVNVDSCFFAGLVNITAGGRSEGPITFNDCTMSGNAKGDVLRVANLNDTSMGLVNFTNDQLACGESAYVQCLDLSGPDVVNITDTSIHVGYKGDTERELLYHAGTDTNLELYGVHVTGSFKSGTQDASSVVTGVPLP